MTSRMRNFLTSSLMPSSVFAAFFIVSCLLFLMFRPHDEGRVFFYPDNAGVRIGSERREIPSEKTLEAKITSFLEELVLGPINLELSPAMPKETAIKHVAVIERTAYVDLDSHMLKADSELSVSFDQALDNIRHNILFNFSLIENVVFTIEGQQVHAPYYAGKDATN